MPAPTLHHLVYQSSATAPFSEAELQALLRQSRAWNEAHDLTGVLLYCEGDILQVLEGPTDEVLGIFARIERDYRHRGVTKLADGPIAQRNFADWSMGFGVVTPADYRHLSGFRPLEEAEALVKDTDRDAASLHELLSEFVHKDVARL
ncbi:BLUF domain-containing protein [Hymenobacter sp. 15J16-1T3B]|uniref:BLUF domain-containing protein n=1 Tax=Hymenobacter sp. 15J16-1T3B TaxID=2886941 RepID=UPI001D1030D6|nr:BLUF domain-containing protein [Hymenobacter sp. 15J16-1T3B]MCC3159359.1 BLUF domain-containing protein [Hymenobacter sp. 15J16-1T3B]